MKAKLSATAVLGGIVLGGLWWGWQTSVADAAGTSPPVPPDLPVVSPGTHYRGLAVQVASGYYQPVETYRPMFEEIAALGANTVLLCVPGHMEHAKAQIITMDVRHVPAPADFKAIIGAARELGLRTFIMPIVLLKKPRGSEWRGVIDPPDWDEWWAQYNEFVLYFADIAREAGAEGLLVGSELVSTEKYTSRWEALIAKCRTHFYGGKLGYSANWDHYRPIEFWDKLDFVGMTSYYTLADKESPSVTEIIAKWQPIKEDILAWQRKVRKPLMMTEVGWCSQPGAAKNPWNYYANQRANAAGMEEQRRLYEAFIRTWHDTPELMGVIWWEWDRSSGGPDDYGYTPRGKPAEAVLRAWFGAARKQETTAAQRPVPSAAPDTSDGG